MKKEKCFLSIVICCLLAAAFALLSACGDGGPVNVKKPTVIPEGYSMVTLGEKAGVNLYGTGVEFDPHFFSQNVSVGLCDEKDWDIIVRRVKEMEIDRFRIMLLPSWIEPFNDNDDPDTISWNNLTPESPEMESVYKVLDLAEENGIDVNLTLWGAEATPKLLTYETQQRLISEGGHFLARNNEPSWNSIWMVGAKEPEEFAENFSIYIQNFFNRGYSCITEITPFNEPDIQYVLDGQSSIEGYIEMCYCVHERFVKDGIRDRVLFTLSDNVGGNEQWLIDSVENLSEISDIFSSHTYLFGYNSKNSTIKTWEEENINITRHSESPHIIGEYGSNNVLSSTRQSDIDKYERGVLMVRLLLNFYNAGAAGTSYWTLFDQQYNYLNSYDEMMQLGLFKSTKRSYVSDNAYYSKIKEDYEVRPQYYAFSLFSKHVKKRTEVYPIEFDDDFALGSAFLDSDGKWVYVFANGNNEKSFKLSLLNGSEGDAFDRYVYSGDALPEDDSPISSSETVSVTNNVLSFELAAQTVVVLKQK